MTTTPLTVRCSSMPLIWACPASQEVLPGEPILNQSSEPAEAGNAVHRWLGAYAQGIELDQAALAKEHGCDENELRMLCAQGVKALTDLRDRFENRDEPMQAEKPLSFRLGDMNVVGSADLLTRSGRIGVVIDYKSGRVDSDYTHQTRSYAAGCLELLDVDEVLVATIWLREGYWDIERLSRAQIESWREEVARRIRNGRANYNPGGHCTYCPRAAACPGRRALVRATMSDLSVEGVPVIEWTQETRQQLGPQIGEMFGRVRLIEKAAQDFRETIKADVEQHGPISIGGGRQLAITETNRRDLDPAKARPVLARFLTTEEIDRATKISVGECESLAVAKAPKGKGAGIKRELSGALESAGAIAVKVTKTLREGKETTK